MTAMTLDPGTLDRLRTRTVRTLLASVALGSTGHIAAVTVDGLDGAVVDTLSSAARNAFAASRAGPNDNRCAFRFVFSTARSRTLRSCAS